MSEEKFDVILERLDLLQYDVSKMEARMDAFENELRLVTHEHGPQLTEMRQEITEMKRFIDNASEVMLDGKPIEATQAPPRR